MWGERHSVNHMRPAGGRFLFYGIVMTDVKQTSSPDSVTVRRTLVVVVTIFVAKTACPPKRYLI